MNLINLDAPYGAEGARQVEDDALPVLSLGDLVERGGLREGEGLRIIGTNGRAGRTLYLDCGSMWRERSNLTHFVSPDGSFKRRRYLAEETPVFIEIVKEAK